MFDFNALSSKLIKLRRDFHKFPELGWTEFRTTSIIATELKKIGWDIYYLDTLIDKNNMLGNSAILEHELSRAIKEGADPAIVSSLKVPGLIAAFDTQKSGKNYGFRFDIDAVATTESDDLVHKPISEKFASIHLGISHACGHDGHTALGLCLAQFIAENKNKLTGKFTFIFQPAEEGCRGAYSLRNLEILSKIDEFYAFHLGICAKSGDIVIHPTNFLVSTKFKVKIIGKSAHAGIEPQKGINALHCAARIADKIFTLKNLRNTARVNLGNFISTNAQNVICDLVTFNGECRDISQELNNEIFRKIQDIIENECNEFGANYSIEMIGNAVSIENSSTIDKIILSVTKKSNLNAIQTAEFNACEDCGHIINTIQNNGRPAGYFILGNTIRGAHHSQYFDLDEVGLVSSLKFLCELVNSLD